MSVTRRVAFFALLVGTLGTSLAVLGIGLAWHHPLSVLLASVACIAFFSLGLLARSYGLFLIFATLPVLGLAPWSGWLTFDEFDFLVLVFAGGAYLANSWRAIAHHGHAKPHQVQILAYLIVVAFLLSLLVSIYRGFLDSGAFSFGWFESYFAPMNSIRLGKSFLLALTLWPVWILEYRQHPELAASSLWGGMAAGLCLASMAAVWERMVFSGLLDFSSEYRTTALFWEMHVGGAALDGWLLLTFPFAFWMLAASRSALGRMLALALIGMAIYVALTTFSRGVYLGLAVVVLVLGATLWRQQLRQSAVAGGLWQFASWGLLLIWVGLLVYFAFPVAGYRGFLALLGLMLVMLALPDILRSLPRLRVLAALGLGLSGGGILVVVSNFLPRGPYILFGMLLLVTLYVLHGREWRSFTVGSSFALAGFGSLVVAALNVAGYWGGVEALNDFGLAVLLVILPLVIAPASDRPLWPVALTQHLRILGAAGVVCGFGAVFLGGAYMGSRFATSAGDFESRVAHWRIALNMLKSQDDLLFGKGTGRFPANYQLAGPREKVAGRYEIKGESGNKFLSLTSAHHPMNPSDIQRVSQRLRPVVSGPFLLEFKARINKPVQLHIEVCDKHLLYEAGCGGADIGAKLGNGTWERYRVAFDGAAIDNGSLGWLKFKVFSIGLLSHSAVVEIDDLALFDSSGTNLLANGGFSDEMARWFMTSDRDHMPWHAKNMLVHLLVEQGLLGLGLFCLMTALAIWRLAFGVAREHSSAPYFLAAIAGFWIVGLFDSLVDVPRLAVAYYLLILVGTSIVGPAKAVRTG